MEKLNIAELLKNCPTGMELDCMMFEGLEFDGIVDNEYLPIRCRIKNLCGGYNVYNFTKYGCWLDTTFAKCVIFPKGKTTWEGFTPPCQFKDGDIVANQNGSSIWIGIYHEYDCLNETFTSYCYIGRDGTFYANSDRGHVYYKTRLATEEEKQKFFKVIKDYGYHWNEETKTLEKLIEPKFKVGDRVKYKNTNICKCIRRYDDILNSYATSDDYIITLEKQDDWELVPNKFDINTLVPFESKVLVRHSETSIWMPAIFGGYDIPNLSYYVVGGTWWQYCIPYKGNEHLRGTADDCNNYYKTWKE